MLDIDCDRVEMESSQLNAVLNAIRPSLSQREKVKMLQEIASSDFFHPDIRAMAKEKIDSFRSVTFNDRDEINFLHFLVLECPEIIRKMFPEVSRIKILEKLSASLDSYEVGE